MKESNRRNLLLLATSLSCALPMLAAQAAEPARLDERADPLTLELADPRAAKVARSFYRHYQSDKDVRRTFKARLAGIGRKLSGDGDYSRDILELGKYAAQVGGGSGDPTPAFCIILIIIIIIIIIASQD
jgi:hypothetical protein